ncbi:PAS domain-containing sensor histidine kinase [Aquimarina sediminis]|uniref:PAS domain-containing sensor histidine kinase n=1 Tax=Aquimarina sediminis TaxID=2070536 RepID=UPI000CA02D76|nr:PAS domain S-box protein [Aquimarina sediminis]
MNTSESSYKHNELTFQVMVDASPNALILVNEKGKIAYTNAYVEDLFQYKRTELIGQRIEVLIPGKFKEHHPRFLQHFFKNPQSRMMGAGRELYALKKDKTEFPVEIGLNPIVTVDGNLVLASIIDITERKKAEKHFKLVVESTPNAMVLVDQNGVIKLVNTQTEKLFKYPRQELLNQKIEILIPDEIKSHHPGYRKNYSKNSKMRPMGMGKDLYAIDKEKNKFPVEIGLNPIETHEGKMVLASIIDITERKKAEEASRLYTKKLENKNKELEQFTFIASHDLQEPLKSIAGLIEILIEDYGNELDENGHDSLAFLQESTERMKELITALLEYSRLGQKSKLEQIDCNELVKTVLKDLDLSIKEATAQFKIAELPTLSGYKTELRLLFQNLINNAIKFRRKDKTPIIKISAQKKSRAWLFKIEDNGIGIDMKFASKIFTIFQQLHSNEEYPGTGIGLSHCKKIIELHDGDIWVESTQKKGSIFYFTINLKQS